MATAKLTRFIECGKIINTHGCHGDVKVEPWTDTPRDLIDLGRVFVGEGETKKEMKKVLHEIQDGTFARNWIMENKMGRAHFNACRRIESEHQLEKVGAELRKLYDWNEED